MPCPVSSCLCDAVLPIMLSAKNKIKNKLDPDEEREALKRASIELKETSLVSVSGPKTQQNSVGSEYSKSGRVRMLMK